MALLFIDGFDNYDIQGKQPSLAKWDPGSTAQSLVAGRYGGSAILMQNTSAFKTLPSTMPLLVAGAAVKPASLLSDLSGLLAFWDNVSTVIQLFATTQGSVQINDTHGNILGTSGVGMVVQGSWSYIELRVLFDPVNGSYDVHVNGVSVLSASGINTGTANGSVQNQVQVGGLRGAQICFDDFYVLDGSGSINQTFLGSCQVYTGLPVNDSVYSANMQWTPATGTSHYPMVDNVPPNYDVQYVSTASLTRVDTYRFPPLSLSGDISGVQVALCEICTANDTESASTLYASNGVNYTGSASFPLNGSTYPSYEMDTQIYENDPATGTVWSVSGINSAEFGVIRIT